MDDLSNFFAKFACDISNDNKYYVGSVLINIVHILKMYDEDICSNYNMREYFLQCVKSAVNLTLTDDSIDIIKEHYMCANLELILKDLYVLKSITPVYSTSKRNCSNCDSKLVFYNNMYPTPCTIFDDKRGTFTILLVTKYCSNKKCRTKYMPSTYSSRSDGLKCFHYYEDWNSEDFLIISPKTGFSMSLITSMKSLVQKTHMSFKGNSFF